MVGPREFEPLPLNSQSLGVVLLTFILVILTITLVAYCVTERQEASIILAQ